MNAGAWRGRRVFISYSRADASLVNHIVDALAERGHEPWIDVEDIVAGSWAASIVEAIRRSDVVVVVLTGTSVRSKEVIKEVRLAAKRHVPLVPVVVHPPPPIPDDIEYHIVGEQRISVDPQNPTAGVWALVRAVEGSTTQRQRRARRGFAAGLAALIVLGVIALGVATVLTGRLPPWGPTPACASVTAQVQNTEPRTFVTLTGATIDIRFRNASDSAVGLPRSGDVTVRGADGFQYQLEPALVPGGRAWFLSESIASQSTKVLTLGIASEASRPRRDTLTIRVPGVSESPVPILRCEVTVADVPVVFAR